MFGENSNNINDYEKSKSYKSVSHFKIANNVQRYLLILFTIFVLFLFLPWTQNISSSGLLTTLNPEQRPQEIHSVIAGRIENWFIKEGDFVKKGDTIVFISEIKDDYFDDNLLDRTSSQIKAKESTVSSYMEKVKSLDSQIDAMIETKELKIKQTKNKYLQQVLKVKSDSIDYEVSKINLSIAEKQVNRIEELYDQGIKSLTDLELKRNKYQEALSKNIGSENKLLMSKNDLINISVELNSIRSQYRDKISKSESEKYTALSSMYDAEGTVTKMQNQFSNYTKRTSFYYIKAPQDGYITKTFQNGIGQTIKEGDKIVSIMPKVYDIAAEIFVKPIDLPLLKNGQEVRFIFDGWPAIVFSGWPNYSFGTFGGEIVAIDRFTSPNGKYRVLVKPLEDERWPEEIRVGSGVKGMALLNDVPLWYELWRKLNGFPPDFYTLQNESDKGKKDSKGKK